MRYKYNKENLIYACQNLAKWVEHLDEKEDREKIDYFWDALDKIMDDTQMEFSDCFGTEGYEFRILGKD